VLANTYQLLIDCLQLFSGTMGKKKEDIEMSAKNSPVPTGPVKSRSCTDIICVLLFIVFVGGWVGVGVIGFQAGDPEQLVYPSNSEGEICGRKANEGKPNLFFHDLTKCISISAVFGCPTPQVCVENCPQKTTSLYAYVTAKDTGLFPKFNISEQRQFCVLSLNDTVWNEAVADSSGEKLLKLISARKCPAYTLESIPIAGRCVPSFGLVEGKQNETTIKDEDENTIQSEENVINAETVLGAINYIIDLLNLRGFAEKVWADLVTSKWMILAGQGVSVVVAFVWIFLMRFLASFMVWLSLFLTIALLALSTAYSWIRYASLRSDPDAGGSVFDVNPITQNLDTYLQLKDTWLFFFIASTVLLAVILLVTLFLRNRIRLAVALITEASKAVGSIMSSIFFPIISFIFQLVVMAWFVFVCMYLASSSEKQYVYNNLQDEGCPSTGSCDPETFDNTDKCECLFYKLGPNELENYLQIYNVFGLFWGLCFVSALGEMVLAGAFSSWYWVFDKSDVPTLPVLFSFGRTLRYHTGTLAFGSLIIAIIKMIRLALQYIQDKLEEKGADNPVVKVILCLCKCCFWCLEKFMKFINRNAYILTAIYGTNFCKSAKEAFSLILRNMVRVAVLDKVTDFLLFLGKVVITSTVALCSFWYFSGGLNAQFDLAQVDLTEPKLNYYFVPVFLITIGAYFIASCFFSVYTMAVDTLFLCFLVDMEKNDGSREKPYFMSKKLMSILNLKQKKK